jgi:hypothetical protein
MFPNSLLQLVRELRLFQRHQAVLLKSTSVGTFLMVSIGPTSVASSDHNHLRNGTFRLLWPVHAEAATDCCR